MIIELVIASIATLVFAGLFIWTSVRLRSKEKIVYYLLFYVSLGLVLSGLRLTTAFIPLLPVFVEVSQLALILAFGALTLAFLKKVKNPLVTYGVVAGVILLLWNLLAFNVLGWSDLISATLTAQTGFDLRRLPPLAVMLAGLGWLMVLVWSLIALIVTLRKRQTAQYQNKLRYWLIVITLLITGGLFLLIDPTWHWLGLTLVIIASALVSYTVLIYRTADLQLILGRTLRGLGVTGGIFALLFLSMAAALLVSRGATIYPTYQLLWFTALAALILAVLLPLLWDILNRFLTRILFGKAHRDQRQIIQRYSRSISSVLDMNRLGDTIINLMIETLGIERGIVFVNERSGGGNVSFRPFSSIGMGDVPTGQFTNDSPFITHLRQGAKTLSQYDLDMLPQFRSLSAEERKWLASLGMELFVPILRERELIGLLTFGAQNHGAFYSEDFDLMIALADQAALAIDSARLFEHLAVINHEVGELTGQLAGLDQDKSDFLSIASHELRTPLTHIHGYSRMLLDLTEEELQNPTYVKSIIEGIVKGSDRMKDVVDLMFDVTEAGGGEINLFLGPVVLEEVIDQATRPYLPALDQRRIAFQKKNLKELPVIEADGTRLMQAFENLIGNAIKYTPDGGMVSIEGRATVLDNIGSAVEIVVADTGIGIDSKDHERIFEKFYRVDDTAHHSTGKTKFKGAGPGLGLTLVKGIAAAHGGKVWVESLGHDEVNCPGSKFFFVIPLHAIQPGKTPQSLIETRHWRREDSKTTK